jgi:hypothetical protein
MQNRPGMRSKLDGITPYDGMWDFDGSCAPGNLYASSQETFSVACFQWIKSRGTKDGLKRGKSVKRFSGRISNPDAVYTAAMKFCQAQTKLSLEGAVQGVPAESSL